MEHLFSSLWFWLGIIALVAIVGGFVSRALSGRNVTKREIAEAQNGGTYKKWAEEQAEVTRQLLERLDALDMRLATIEKTLTDIPG